jgi:hypothetical protein
VSPIIPAITPSSAFTSFSGVYVCPKIVMPSLPIDSPRKWRKISGARATTRIKSGTAVVPIQ